MSILYYTKLKSSLRYKNILNYAMLYFMVLMIIGLKFSKNPKNNKINLWLKCNLIILDKTIMKIFNK